MVIVYKTWYYHGIMSKAQYIMSKNMICQKIWCYYGTHSTIKIHIYTYTYIDLFLPRNLSKKQFYHHTSPKTCYYHGTHWPTPPRKKNKKQKTKQNMVLPWYMPKTLSVIPRIKNYIITVSKKHDYQGKCHKKHGISAVSCPKNMVLPCLKAHTKKVQTYYHGILGVACKQMNFSTIVCLKWP